MGLENAGGHGPVEIEVPSLTILMLAIRGAYGLCKVEASLSLGQAYTGVEAVGGTAWLACPFTQTGTDPHLLH